MLRIRLFHNLIYAIAAATLSACATTSPRVNQAASHAIAVRPVAMPGLRSDERQALKRKIQVALISRDCKTAHDPLQTLLWDNPDDEAVRIELADCALSLGKTKAAHGHYAQLSGPRALAGRALSDIALGQSGDTELALNAALEVNMDDIRLWNALGHHYDQSGRYLDAQDSYIRALSAGADHDVIVNNMGMSLLLEGRYSEAQSKFVHALDINPSSRTYDINRRLALALMGDYGAAISFVHPDDAAQIYNDAGYIAMTREQKPLAAALFRKALAISPVYFSKAEDNLKALRLQSSAP